MTMTPPEGTAPPRREPKAIALPPLTAATISRAREGLAAARNQEMRMAARAALTNVQQIIDGKPDKKVSGHTRRLLLRIFIGLLFRVRVEQPQYIPTGPVMLASNHLNHMDPFLLLSTTRDTPYYYVLGDARTMFNKPWKRIFTRLTGGVIPVDRLWKEELAVIDGARTDHAELASLAKAIHDDVPDGGSIETLRVLDRVVQALFARGDALVIFPEGGLGTHEAQLRLPIKRGTVLYAMRSGVPIVPVAIIGTRDLFWRKQLTVRYGPPIVLPHIERPRPKQVQAALDELQTAMQSLMPQHYEDPNEPRLFRRALNQLFW